MIDFGLRNRVVLVTGATQGIGRDIARLMAAQGAWVAVSHFADAHGAKSLIDEIRSEGGRAMLAAGSLHDAEGAWKVARNVEVEWAQIDILVHTASLLNSVELVSSPHAILNELLPGMQQRQWGRIVLLEWANAPIANHLSLPSISTTPTVLLNVVHLPRPLVISNAAIARLTLFLASAWNLTSVICTCAVGTSSN